MYSVFVLFKVSLLADIQVETFSRSWLTLSIWRPIFHVSFWNYCKSLPVVFEVLVQVGELHPISKHREELKIQGEAEYFNELGGVLTS